MTAAVMEQPPAATADLSCLVETYLAASLARGHSRGTVGYRRIYLRQMLTWLETRGIRQVRAVSAEDLGDYLAFIRSSETSYNREKPSLRSVHTLAAEVSVVRSFFGWLASRGAISVNPARELKLGLERDTSQKPVLTVAEAEALLAAPGDDLLGVRDRAILETLYSTALRRAELCALDCGDVDGSSGVVRVRAGKGGRDRVVPIGSVAVAAVRRYLKESRPALAGDRKLSALFIAAITHSRLGEKSLNLIVPKYARKAGLMKCVTPHTLRHTCATHLLQGGADIRDVQAILGHVSIETTRIYTRVSDEDLVSVWQRHHPRERMRVP